MPVVDTGECRVPIYNPWGVVVRVLEGVSTLFEQLVEEKKKQNAIAETYKRTTTIGRQLRKGLCARGFHTDPDPDTHTRAERYTTRE